MNDLALYQITDEYAELMQLALDEEADEDSFGQALDALSGEFHDKVTAIAQVVRNLESNGESIMAAMNTMKVRVARAEKRAAYLREYLKLNMKRVGISKIESPWFVVGIRKNPPHLMISEDARIPHEYIRVIPERQEPDKVAITKAIKAGAEVEGCELITETRLEIR